MKSNHLSIGGAVLALILSGSATSSFAAESPISKQCETNENSTQESLSPDSYLKTETILSEIPISINDPNSKGQDTIALIAKGDREKNLYIGLKITNISSRPYELKKFGLGNNLLPISGGSIIIKCGQHLNLTTKATLKWNGEVMVLSGSKTDGWDSSEIHLIDPKPIYNQWTNEWISTSDELTDISFFLGYAYSGVYLEKVKRQPSDNLKDTPFPSRTMHSVELVRTGDKRYLVKKEFWHFKNSGSQKNFQSKLTSRIPCF